MVALALEERGIDVVSVGNGEAAVRRIPDLAPDLVLADVFMPVRNGYEVCEFVKTNERFSHVPVILLVGAFDPLDEKEARRVGADGVLKKPFVPPDPLIAMVTSALEKNPHVAAEMEKAREAPVPPEPELPAIALEPPARMAPKPLPDFPEPSPEEAALIYGFEKRAEARDDDAQPRFSHKQDDSDDDFDHAATARDWRRSAADLEIPDDLNSKAITPDEGFSTVVFPSERDGSAKRISLPPIEPLREPRAAAPLLNSVPGFSTVEKDASPLPASLTKAPADAAPAMPAAPAQEPAEPVRQNVQIEQNSSAPSTDANHTSFEMDPLPSPSEYADDGWMSSLLGKFRRGKAHEGEPANAVNGQAAESPASEPVAAVPEHLSSWSEAIVLARPSEASHQESPIESSGAGKPEQPEQPEGDFFAEESEEAPEAPAAESWFAPNPATLDDSAPHTDIPAFSAQTAGNLLASPADVNDEERSQCAAGFEANAPDTVPKTHSDSGLESSSPYVQSSSIEYERANQQQEHTPFSGTDSDSGTSEYSGDASPLPRPANAQASSDSAAKHERLRSIFAPPSPEVAAKSSATPASVVPTNETSERIPTGPPPNREALADIPFLMPPPPAPFAPPTNEEPKTAEPAEPPSVDAVVNRLLEKLQPQIHDMLAKDLLKPLVENLLQQELPNKSK